MAQKVFVSVEKEMTFQGRTERYSNVYPYLIENPSVAEYQAIEDACLAAERPVHSSQIKFVRTRTYTTEGLNTLDAGSMLNITERNTQGTASNINPAYGECAVLVKWPLPRKTLVGNAIGRQRSLKKWIRGLHFPTLASTEISGQAALSASAKTPFLTYAAAVRVPKTGVAMVSPDDSAEPNDTATVHPYVEHRQFPRGRKEE